MKQSQRQQLAIAVAACAGAAILYYFMTPRPVLDDVQEPLAAVETLDLSFKENLLVSSDNVSIDGGEPQILPCGHEIVVFGSLPLDKTTVADLYCTEDYLGGVKLRYKSKDGADFETVDIGQRDADAGDLWDIRSLISRTADERLIIETMVLSSSENEKDSAQTAACSVRQEAVVWDQATKTFIPYNELGKFSLNRFVPPVNVVNDCLDAKGAWLAK